MYEDFYGLTGKPFQLNPDPAFFYGSRGHKRAFAYLQYGLYQSEGFIVITGEIGAGKTTIVRNLFEHLDRDRLVAAQLVSTQLDADDMLRAVAVAFGLPIKSMDKASLLASLEAFLCQVAIDRKRALLVVDEAQNLTPRAIEELRMLSNFQLGDQALLQSFLIGQPELRGMMQGPQMQQLRQRVIASYHLGPMDRAETQAYVEHRLSHVGWKGDPGFAPVALDLIHVASGGIPRRINTLCNRLLLAGFLGEKHAFEVVDVQAIVREIRDELGPEASLVTVPAVSESSATGMAGDAPVGVAGSATTGASKAPPVAAAGTAREAASSEVSDPQTVTAHLREIEARLDRLEKSVGRAIGLLQRLLHPERVGKPGTPMGR